MNKYFMAKIIMSKIKKFKIFMEKLSMANVSHE